MLWTRQLGTSATDFSSGVAVDGTGNAYITGGTYGSLGGPYAGGIDVFLAKFGPTPCYANCNGSTTPLILKILDFSCFLNKFASGCP